MKSSRQLDQYNMGGEGTDRVISMLCEYICEQLGHPALDRVRVTIYKSANTEDSSVALTNGSTIDWRLSTGNG